MDKDLERRNKIKQIAKDLELSLLECTDDKFTGKIELEINFNLGGITRAHLDKKLRMSY